METEAMKPTCPFNECDGSGWVLVRDEDGELMLRCRCLLAKEQQARLERLFKAARVPRRFQQKRLEDFDSTYQKGAWKIARRYVEQFEAIRGESKNGLCFIGPPGTGKSHLAYGILNSLLGKGVPGVCGSVPEIMDLLRPQVGLGQEAQERLELLKTLDVVILDDLGAERNTEWVTERLYVIINARYNEMLPTIITSNLELEELEKLPGWERITSRLFEMCHVVVVDGPDYRKTGKG
jgi:DNA replication protein DnaC